MSKSNDDILWWGIDTFELETAPPYVALSYTWGEPTPTKDIHIDRRKVPVRENLYHALDHIVRNCMFAAPWQDREGDVQISHDLAVTMAPPARVSFRQTEKPRPKADKNAESQLTLFWIDALCIDQSSIPERNQQVSFMGDIYSRAAFVMAWLGSPEAESELAMDIIRQHMTMVAMQLMEEGWKAAVKALLQRPYWSRLWVAQEFLLAKDILICCGTKQVTWDRLSSWESEAQPTFSAPSVVKSRIKMGDGDHLYDPILVQYQNSPDEMTFTRLQEWISVSSHLQCADPRDKVYGLLSMPGVSAAIKVDYAKTKEELYVEMVTDLVGLDGSGLDDAGGGRVNFLNQFPSQLQEALGLRDVKDLNMLAKERTLASDYSRPPPPPPRVYKPSSVHGNGEDLRLRALSMKRPQDPFWGGVYDIIQEQEARRKEEENERPWEALYR